MELSGKKLITTTVIGLKQKLPTIKEDEYYDEKSSESKKYKTRNLKQRRYS